VGFNDLSSGTSEAKTNLCYRGELAINGKIHSCLKKKRNRKEDKNTGWVYIFESFDHAPGHVKIGITNDEPGKRQERLEKCRIPLVEVEDSDRDAFDYHWLVESLLWAELHNCRKKFTCNVCSKNHQEWYEIDTETALKHVAKWRNWIKAKEPFDKQGNFTSYWQWRFDQLQKTLDDVKWEGWTNPSQSDYWKYQRKTFGNKCLPLLLDHLSRKYDRFLVTGVIILLVLYIRFGAFGVMWGAIGLIAL
jgi:hypothetical protein